MSHPLEFAWYYFILHVVILGVLLFYFYLIRFVGSSWGTGRSMRGDSIFLQFYREKVRLHYLLSW